MSFALLVHLMEANKNAKRNVAVITVYPPIYANYFPYLFMTL